MSEPKRKETMWSAFVWSFNLHLIGFSLGIGFWFAEWVTEWLWYFGP